MIIPVGLVILKVTNIIMNNNFYLAFRKKITI